MENQFDGLDESADESQDRAAILAEGVVRTTKRKAQELQEELKEGALTKRIETMTSKVPSATFLGLAVASVGLSALLRTFGRKDDSQFVGQWVPTILALGLYSKLTELEVTE